MAATAAYVSVARIPYEAQASDGPGIVLSNASADSASFRLLGGKYGVTCVASTFGTVTLQILGADGSTWLTALTAFSANGYADTDLPPGTYRVHLA